MPQLGMNWEDENEKDIEKSPKEILYADSIKERQEQKERSNLIDELGDNLSQAQILYSSKEKLEEIKEELKKSVSAKFPKDSPEDRFNYDDRIINNNNLSKEEKLRALNNEKQALDKQIQKEGNIEKAKLYGMAAAETALDFAPMTKVAKIGSKVVSGALKTKLGRKVSESIGKGLGTGALSGANHGAFEAIREDKNVPLEALKGSVTGAVSGAVGGALGSKIEQKFRGMKLKNAGDIKNADRETRRNFRKEAQKYYKDYNQDVVVNNKDIGEIKFNDKGMRETLSRNPNAAKDFPDLKNDVKNARLTETNGLYKKREDNSISFYTLEGKNKYLVAQSKEGKKYYLTKKSDDSGLLPSWGGFMSSPNNIIPQQNQNFNIIGGLINFFKRR